MIKIPNLELYEWLSELPDYQRKIIEQLIKEYGEEEAINRWLLANGPSNTIKFGGEGTTKPFLDSFKEEFRNFLCGHDDYKKERNQFSEQGEITRTTLVSSLSSWMGAKLGVATTVIAPVVVIMLFTIGKITINAYCKSFE